MASVPYIVDIVLGVDSSMPNVDSSPTSNWSSESIRISFKIFVLLLL
jgi:hypothetical protein